MNKKITSLYLKSDILPVLFDKLLSYIFYPYRMSKSYALSASGCTFFVLSDLWFGKAIALI